MDFYLVLGLERVATVGDINAVFHTMQSGEAARTVLTLD